MALRPTLDRLLCGHCLLGESGQKKLLKKQKRRVTMRVKEIVKEKVKKENKELLLINASYLHKIARDLEELCNCACDCDCDCDVLEASEKERRLMMASLSLDMIADDLESISRILN